MNLTLKQQKQENQYQLPYHWFMNRDTYKGREYYGYLNLCSSLLNKDRNSFILDAGCGDGRFIGKLINAGFKNVYGLDYSDKALSFAKLIVPQAKFIKADLKEIPLEDRLFDRITLIETLEHIIPEQIDDILSELNRILKSEGRLIITVPSILNGLPSLKSKHYQHFTKESLQEAIEKFFLIDKIYGQNKTGFSMLKFLYKFLDNKYWVIKPLARYYNLKIWPKYFNICLPKKGRRLIVVCKKR